MAMFRTTIPLGRFAGIPVGAHWSVVIVLALIADLLATSVLPTATHGHPTFWYWVTGVATALCFLASLLAHELAHAVLARRYGVGVKRITLWMLGGAAELEGEPPSPKADLVIAVAGPLTSLVLGGVFWGTAALTGQWLPVLVALGLAWIGITNVLLAVFNLLPGAPLDGGRVLRAAVWKRTGNRARAHAVAGRTGQVLGFALAIAGLAEMLFSGSFDGLWLALIGWFLIFAAQAELAGGSVRERLGGVRVCDIMDPEPVVAPGWWTVEAFLGQVAVTTRRRAFPVVSFDGQATGVTSLGELTRLPDQARLTSRVADIARKPPAVPTATRDDLVIDVVSKVTLRPGRDLVLVLDHGRLAGVIGPDDLSRALELAASGHPLRPGRTVTHSGDSPR